MAVERRTLFANERVIAVVGVVGISCNRASTVADDSEVKFFRAVRMD
jgi:hypothetical protein